MKNTNSTQSYRGNGNGNGRGNRPGARTVRNSVAEATSLSRKRIARTSRPQRRDHSVIPHSLRGLNRSPLSVALVPFVFLGISCCFSLVQRAAAAITRARTGDVRLGGMRQVEAEQYALYLCSTMTGSRGVVVDTSGQSAYSWRHHAPVREWNVLCDSTRGQYLFRINADSQTVYGINRLDAAPADTTEESSARQPDSLVGGTLTAAAAEKRAHLFLRLAGVPAGGLEHAKTVQSTGLTVDGQPMTEWHFIYHRRQKDQPDRLVMISIDGRTGAIEHLWNPTNTM